MKKPIEFFTPVLPEPPNYNKALPYFCNAYICASIAKLARKESVIAAHTNDEYKEAVRKTLTQWGLDDAEKPVFINSKEIGGHPGTQGLIFFHNDTAFIVFRSTERKLNDWMTNLNSRQTDCPYTEGRVHRGFLEAFEAIVIEEGENLPAFEEVIERLQNAKNGVWITGHSLGGALASIAASYLLNSNIRVSGIYTFGAPRVGNDEYRDYLNKRLTYKYWRFMHKSDLVPDVPFPLSRLKWLPHLAVTGYSREGCMLRLTDEGDYYEVLRLVDRNGKRTRLGPYHGSTWDDHSVDFYRDRLLYLARRDKPDFPEMKYVEVPPGIKLETTNDDIKAIESSVSQP